MRIEITKNSVTFFSETEKDVKDLNKFFSRGGNTWPDRPFWVDELHMYFSSAQKGQPYSIIEWYDEKKSTHPCALYHEVEKHTSPDTVPVASPDLTSNLTSNNN
jgi:hypothetical protein